MHLKVHNGTASNGETTLCATCRLSTIVRGRSLDEEIVQCHAMSMRSTRVTFKVTYCSAYSDARRRAICRWSSTPGFCNPGRRSGRRGSSAAQTCGRRRSRTSWSTSTVASTSDAKADRGHATRSDGMSGGEGVIDRKRLA